MKALIGLGNPGREYDGTRHNAGFAILDQLVAANGGSWTKARAKGLQSRLEAAGTPVVAGKPHTFMNLSGHFVASLLSYFRIAPADLLVIHDDLDLPLGRLRLSHGGGSGGHKGLTSIIEQLGTRDFDRLRVGVGKPDEKSDVVDHVLSSFGTAERRLFEAVSEHCVKAVECWLRHGIIRAMNDFNSIRSDEPQAS